MKPSQSIKPISYLKSNTADVVRELNEVREPVIITQNGVAKAVMQDVETFEQTQETLALLKLLAQGQHSVEQGATRSLRKAVNELRKGLSRA